MTTKKALRERLHKMSHDWTEDANQFKKRIAELEEDYKILGEEFAEACDSNTKYKNKLATIEKEIEKLNYYDGGFGKFVRKDKVLKIIRKAKT